MPRIWTPKIQLPTEVESHVQQALRSAIGAASQPTYRHLQVSVPLDLGGSPRTVEARAAGNGFKPAFHTYFRGETPMAEADFRSPSDVHNQKQNIGDVLERFLKWTRDSPDSIDLAFTAGGIHGYNRSSRSPKTFNKELEFLYPDLYEVLDKGYVNMQETRPGMFATRTSVKANRPNRYDPIEMPFLWTNPEQSLGTHNINRGIQDYLSEISDATNAYPRSDPREFMSWAHDNVHPYLQPLLRERFQLSALLGALGTGALAHQSDKKDEV